jgi:hypothetical protein
MRWEGHEARTGEIRDVYSVLMEKPEGKRPLGRRGRLILKLIFRKWDGAMDWIDLA